ncbi:uncharacterized protein LOC123274429 [Cotesia glomerata]|uniref:uncharacterized protein LOC123274429 n=1 Tax=Cotesia glomerata TaxID=32391 RepID=UPI001D02325B|nr:uncharacterized protein LOC123274429 [Cotesia glomerata]
MIVKQHLFGQAVAFNWVIEFQKRGLPHLHMLVTLTAGCKITTSEHVDRLISAEIPNPLNGPTLFDIVTRNMLHGPCGDWCLINNICSKKYPKSFRHETTMDENGYPYYRRRDEGMIFERHDHIFDNRHVVPYNKTLLETFNCHINVEVVSSVKAVKYLFKDVYKGHDKAEITINGSIPNTRPEPMRDQNQTSQNDGNIPHTRPEPTRVQNETSQNNVNSSTVKNHDEIRNFVDARYVGPVEGVWRTLSKDLQDKSHSVTRLPVHLPNQQSITITDDCTDIDLHEAIQKQSMLIDYFKLNERDPNAHQYIYSDIPHHYVFKKDKDTKISSWQPRKRQFNVIGRMYSISPAQVELFHLRLLLLHIKGATSFENLRTVNRILCDTFMSACLAAGLIEDDQEWRKTLIEAVVWMMPRQLRYLFVRILMHCQPLKPEELWNEFKGPLSEDFNRNFEPEEAQRRAYIHINFILNREGHNVLKFSSMPQIDDIDNIMPDDELLQSQEQEDPQLLYNKLNAQKKEIVDLVVDSLNNTGLNTPSPNCIYIDGPGGSGKTFIYKTLYQILTNDNKQVCTMAYTGIAATLLPNGKTVHKTFGLLVPMFSDSSSYIKLNSKQGQYLKNIDVFIWDEAPMSPRYALEIIDRTLRHIMDNDIPFGGKLVILGGDFRQLLPVQPHATRSETVNLSIKFSFLWKYFRKFSLTQNMRALPNEREFIEFLLNIGDGTLNDYDDQVNLPAMCFTSTDDNIVENVYGAIIRARRFRGLSDSTFETLGVAKLKILNIEVEFQVCREDLPFPAVGILGNNFLETEKSEIVYDNQI